MRVDDETMKLCRICLKSAGLSELTLKQTLPKSKISITYAVKKAFDIEVKIV
jgi:hypothetical protein